MVRQPETRRVGRQDCAAHEIDRAALNWRAPAPAHARIKATAVQCAGDALEHAVYAVILASLVIGGLAGVALAHVAGMGHAP